MDVGLNRFENVFFFFFQLSQIHSFTLTLNYPEIQEEIYRDICVFYVHTLK